MCDVVSPVSPMLQDTLPEDVKGMFVSEGVLCHLGGMTSHAAVVARGWGKPCITGVSDLLVRGTGSGLEGPAVNPRVIPFT